MKTLKMFSTLALAGLLGTACAGQPEDGTELDDGAREAEESYGPEASTPAPAGAAVLSVAALDDGREYLTDGGGRALYLLEDEPEGQSNCHEGCAEIWPPFLATQGAPRAGGGAVDDGLVGTIQRSDGTTQVTYAGHALYYFHQDEGPADRRGQDRADAWGEWYLVQPDGKRVEEHPEESITSEP